MKSLLCLLLVASIASASAAQVTKDPAIDSGPAGSVTLSGAIVAEGTGNPIAYSTVKLQPLGRERFTDRQGAFVYYAVLPGKYTLNVRMLGYLPLDTAITVYPEEAVSLTLTMIRIPTSLDEVQVKAPPRQCIFPDEMGYVADAELGTVLDEARKNAQREQLLRRTYPFEFRLAQSHDTRDMSDGTTALQYDTVTYRSDDNWRYRKGKVVSDDRNRLFGEVRLMRLPTLADLADRQFLTAHCFKYSGVVEQDGKPVHRIDFAADSSVAAPDVEGSIYIDSATYLIRRAQFRLTRGGTVKPPILALEVTTTYKEILPNVALFDEIRSVQPLAEKNARGHPVEFRETQRLLSYRFLMTGPPGTQVRKWIHVESDALNAVGEGQSSVQGRARGVGPPPC
ncbi:MAG TPA: carboxypeptidase regulatory-like domain-containing protein, partial [Gemmatimonadaceae bacterium]|nr:carboxypeptidase regulatory-like domain-containing protein [Gemmatimonadaceae bacterium]